MAGKVNQVSRRQLLVKLLNRVLLVPVNELYVYFSPVWFKQSFGSGGNSTIDSKTDYIEYFSNRKRMRLRLHSPFTCQHAITHNVQLPPEIATVLDQLPWNSGPIRVYMQQISFLHLCDSTLKLRGNYCFVQMITKPFKIMQMGTNTAV